VLTDGPITLIPELNMLRPIEGVDKVDSSPCENGPLTNADCSYAGSAAYGDVLYECEVRIVIRRAILTP